jgi:hypothetical protein
MSATTVTFLSFGEPTMTVCPRPLRTTIVRCPDVSMDLRSSRWIREAADAVPATNKTGTTAARIRFDVTAARAFPTRRTGASHALSSVVIFSSSI